MKRTLFLALLLSVTASAFAEEVEINGLWYELMSKTKVASVIQYKNKVRYSGDIVIPGTVNYNGFAYSVTSIRDYAFDSCSGLTSVTIPNSVTWIGISVFYGCSGLTSVTIPNSVTSIGSDAFSGCRGLTSVTIPNSVTSIGSSAFSGCSGLTSVTIPNSVTSIGSFTFSNCSGLTSVTIPNSVMSIEWYAFSDCSGLTTINISSGVKKINEKAFAKCVELADVYCYAETVPSTNSDAFEDSHINYATLHVPTASIDAYKGVEPWKSFKTIMGLDGTTPEVKKCDKPNIIFMAGKFRFECSTPGATFKSKLTPNVEEQMFEGSEVVFQSSTLTYTLTVIASAEDYEDSDPVTMTITIEKTDVNQDGTVDVADIATIIDKMAGK